ncbi:hypothetical protein V2J09_007781 [Rumex salicifolius]
MDGTDAKEEARELYPRSGKTDKDRKFQGRGDDCKEGKSDRIICNDKVDAKSEKENYGSGSGFPNQKEHQKGKRHADSIGGNGDADRVDQRVHLQGTVDLRKDYSTNYQKEQVEANEDVKDKTVVVKGDDKDKDRKKTEGKHRDSREREKDKNGDRDSLQFVAGGSNRIELATKEKEGGRPEGDKKDVHLDKVGPSDNDYVKKEVRSAVEKEVSLCEELVNRSIMQDNAASGQKKPKEVDGWRNAGKEAGERRKERDGGEGERPEKRTRCADKESDDRSADVHLISVVEKEKSSCFVQQQKGVLPKDSSQVANLEARLRHCALVADRSRTIVYKVGECMQVLLKMWKEYESYQGDKTTESSFGGPTLEVKIPGEHVTATNRQVRREQLWGTDVYTDDSDLVAVLMHMGYCRSSKNPAAPDLQDLHYVSSWRNNVRSRSWGAGVGCSYQVEQCFLVKKGCEPREIQRSLTESSTIEPTFAPISVGRTMTTRAAASNASRKQRMVKEVTILYNLSNEPWYVSPFNLEVWNTLNLIKYSINIVADKGLKKPTFTSARLKKGEVLYMETCRHRYELCYIKEKVVKAGSTHETEAGKSHNHHPDASNGEIVDIFRFSRCKKILPQKIMLQNGIPLPVDMLEVLEDNLDWEDVLWSHNGVWIGGKEYKLARVQFITPSLNVASLV